MSRPSMPCLRNSGFRSMKKGSPGGNVTWLTQTATGCASPPGAPDRERPLARAIALRHGDGQEDRRVAAASFPERQGRVGSAEDCGLAADLTAPRQRIATALRRG